MKTKTKWFKLSEALPAKSGVYKIKMRMYGLITPLRRVPIFSSYYNAEDKNFYESEKTDWAFDNEDIEYWAILNK